MDGHLIAAIGAGPWPLLQLTPPPEAGDIDRWALYVMVLAVVALFGMLIKKGTDAEKKSDDNAAKWEATAKTATTELSEANKTIGRAIGTLERQGVLMEAQAKDLASVKADSVEVRRVLGVLEQEVRGLRDAAHRQSGDD